MMADNIHLHEIADQLKDAEAELATWLRLKTSEVRVRSLSEQYEAAKIATDARRAFDERKAKDGPFFGLNNLEIVEDLNFSNSLKKCPYRVSYTQDEWASELNDSISRSLTHDGFDKLPAAILAWIIERHSDRLPLAIIQLSPGNPKDACNQYLAALLGDANKDQ